ncbi:POL2 [Hepatospora eriocheir]|uniref:POL2 n=1 Tax=Hepatospora eriocheir TaxID=1081669 RepID=A0A1X0QEZ6_9MICR|nr:POL2 [Hepatospora eriocheir]
MVYSICHNINFDSLGNEISHFGVNESSDNSENFINPLQKASNRKVSDSSIGDSFRLTCFYCGKKGHTRKVCYKLKFDRQERRINELSAHVGKKVDETTNERVNKDNLFYLNQVFQKESHSKAIINVKLNNNIIHALVDTGADISIINSKFLMGIKVLEPDISIKAANGSNIKIIGMLRKINIDIDNYEYKGKFYVCKDISYDVILGLDFIRKYFASIKLNEQKVKLVLNEVSNKLIFKPLLRINTGNSAPVSGKYFRTNEKDEKFIKEIIEKYLEKGWIRPSSSPWRSSVVVAKHNGKQRFCINYIPLNKITTQDKYPIPRMEDIFDTISKSKIRSKLDIGKAFHQIDVHPDDIPKTAFACKFGIFEWTKMPFGLVNGSAMFQRVIDTVLLKKTWTSKKMKNIINKEIS